MKKSTFLYSIISALVITSAVAYPTVTTVIEENNAANDSLIDVGHTHEFSEWYVDAFPDCITPGSEYRTCSVCAEEETREIPALGHELVYYDGMKPTCYEDGYPSYAVCSRYNADSGTFCEYSTYRCLPATGHRASAAVKDHINPGTCDEHGSYENVITCLDCKEELSRFLVTTPPLGHDYISYPDKAPTCYEDGYKDRKVCSRCDFETFIADFSLGHGDTYVTIENMVEATCTSEGSYDEVGRCVDCSYEFFRETIIVEKALHDYSIFYEGKEPTCTEDGYESYSVCSVCSDSTYTVRPATGHEHFTTKEDYVYPTCTSLGSYYEVEKCLYCDIEFSRTYKIENALWHDLVEVEAKEPTCTDYGYSSHIKCTRCSFTEGKDYIHSLGHVPGESLRENEVPATCTSEGSYETVTYCTVCNEEVTAREYFTLDQVVHVYSKGTCRWCGELQTPGLNLVLSDDGTYYSVEGADYSGSVAYIPAYYKGIPVTTILPGDYVYDYIYIPETVVSISEINPFYNIKFYKKIQSIFVSSENLEYMSIDGILFTKDGSTLISYPQGKDTEIINLQFLSPTLNRIGSYAFAYNEFLKEIDFGTIENIDSYAFYQCNSLETVNFDNKNSAFLKCGEKAFDTFYGKDVYITSLENWLGFTYFSDEFSNPLSYGWLFINGVDFEEYCDGVFEISSKYFITDYAFLGCLNLPNLVFNSKGKILQLGYKAFYKASFSSVTFIGNIEYVYGASAFEGSSIGSLNIYSPLKYIDSRLFAKCSNLYMIYLKGDKFEPFFDIEMADDAFLDCPNSYLTLSDVGSQILISWRKE